MGKKQRLIIISPIILIATMYPIFHFLTSVLGYTLGWYFGLVIYWIIWGGLFSWRMIGMENIRKIIRPQKLTLKIFLMVLFPLLMAALYRFVPGMGYEKPDVWILLLLLSTNVGNGFFEELLWRGVYMCIFPDNTMVRIFWSSIWFALWHYVPGSVSPDGNVLGLIIGSGLFGFYLSFISKKTNTIWWGILAHMIGGTIMII